jgi:hypothetical protein
MEVLERSRSHYSYLVGYDIVSSGEVVGNGTVGSEEGLCMRERGLGEQITRKVGVISQ